MKALHTFIRPVTTISLTITLLLSGCLDCDDYPVISYFAFEQLSPKVIGEIDQTAHTITLKVPESVDITNLIPTIELGGSYCLQVSPASLSEQDFTQPITYEVYNEIEEVTEYQVSVTTAPGIENGLFTINWSAGSEMPIATAWSSAAELNNLLFICGGIDKEGNVLNEVLIYNASDDVWSLSPGSMNDSRWGHSATTVDGKIYVMGGTNVGQGPALKNIEQYDPLTDTWSTVGEMTKGRIGHGAVEYQGKIYIIGGEYEEPSLTTLPTLEAYDPLTHSWESLSPMPTARIFMGACVLDGVIYVLGGGSKYPYAGIRSVEAYHIAEDRWEKKTPLKSGLGDLRACVIDGKIVCAGGYSMWRVDDATKTVQVYNPETDQAYQLSDMQFAHAAQSMLCFEEKLYVMGGADTMSREVISLTGKTEIGILQIAGK